MISYAQNFEDVILDRVFRHQDRGFYIDVGAMDPVRDSVTKHFYDLGWSGINIEPNEEFYSRLLSERARDINLNLAVGERNGVQEFYVFAGTGNSTLHRAVNERLYAMGHGSHLESIRVTTLAEICRDSVRQPIDFMKIDCEGWEKNVIAGADWDRFRPTVLVIEATEPNSTNPAWLDWEPILTQDNRYEMVYFDGLNRFYLRREYKDLKGHFEAPANIFDNFVPYSLTLCESQKHLLKHEFETEIAAILAEQSRLASNLLSKDGEIEKLRVELLMMEASIKAISSDRDNLTSQVKELTSQADDLRRLLLESRLHVGLLSQQLAQQKLSFNKLD